MSLRDAWARMECSINRERYGPTGRPSNVSSNSRVTALKHEVEQLRDRFARAEAEVKMWREIAETNIELSRRSAHALHDFVMQIARNDFVDSHGHSAKDLAAYQAAVKLIGRV